MRQSKIAGAYIAMTVPAMLLFFGFHTFPALQGFFYSFTNWKGYGDFRFVGLKNYINVFGDSQVAGAYAFTFKFAIVATVLVNVLSILMALGLNADIKAKSFLRAVYFLPNVLGTLVISYIFKFYFSNLIPEVSRSLRLGFLDQNILGSAANAWMGIVVVAVWQATAFNTILFISGLQTIPDELYEAARIDGASRVSQFFRVTLPLIVPFVTINLVLCMKNFLMVFDSIIALTNGGPANATTSISVLIYKGGFQGSLFAYQSANAILFFVVLISVSVFQIKVLEKREAR